MSPNDPSARSARRAHAHTKRARGPEAVRRGKRPPRTFRLDWPLLAVLGIALAIRLWGIGHRLPDSSLGIELLDDSAIEETDRTTMGRAWTMWQGGARPLDLNPHTGGWPSLSFYLSLVIQNLYRANYFMRHPGATAKDFAGSMMSEAASMFLFARIVGALLGVLTVYLTYRIGSRTLGRPAGLLAGLFVAVNALHVLTSQHISDPNLLALLFVLLATEPMIRITRGGGVADSIRAGAMIGLAGACKYVPLVLALPFALAHRSKAAPRDAAAVGKRPGMLGNRAFWYGLLAIPAAMFLASPFLFIDWRRTLIDIGNQRGALFSDWVGQTVFPFSLPTYLSASLPHAMGWPGYLLGLAGLVLMWRAGRAARVLFWIPATIVLANGLLKSPQERYVLPALPYLHIGAALALTRGIEWARGRIPGLAEDRGGRLAPVRIGTGILAAVAIAWPLPELLATRHVLSLPDSRHLSRKWVNQNLDPNKPMAVEVYGPTFYDRERAIVTWPFFATQSQLVRPAFHPEFLDGLEYHVASEEISRRFEAEPAKYPVENAYYTWLRKSATVVWESDVRSMSGPHIVVRRLPRSISTRARRDSIFTAAMPKPNRVDRLELWCVDCSRIFARFGDYVRAEEWARRGLQVGVLEMEPKLRCALAIALWYRGQLDSAETEARLAVEGRPRSATFHLTHGNILADMTRFEPALAEFREALELSGRDPALRLRIAETLVHLGRFDEAVPELLQVPPGHPDRARAARHAADLLLARPERHAEALSLLRESIRRDPNQGQSDLVRQEISRLEAELGPR